MKTNRLVALVALVLLLGACEAEGRTAAPQGTDNPDVAVSAPVPGITLPPDALVDQVPRPDEVPAGMDLVVNGSGPRDAHVVAGYSGSGPVAAAAEARLRAHLFVSAYVAQYANPNTGQVISMVASRFRTATGAAADFADDLKGKQGKTVVSPVIGEQSAVTVQAVVGKTAADLVLVRFRRGTMTWSLAYQAPPPADAQVAISLAQKILSRTAA